MPEGDRTPYLRTGVPRSAPTVERVSRDQDESYETSRLEAWRRATDAPLIVLAVGSLPILLLELDRASLGRNDQAFLDAVNLVVLVAFALDYVVELALSRNRGRASGSSQGHRGRVWEGRTSPSHRTPRWVRSCER